MLVLNALLGTKEKGFLFRRFLNSLKHFCFSPEAIVWFEAIDTAWY